MGGKHLKKLRAEKSKVKLKQKKLPKGQNITDSSFKVKQIQITKQLKEVPHGEIVSSKRLSLQDLLANLHHYNANARHNGLMGIKEILSTNSYVIPNKHVKNLIFGVLEVVVDEDKAVRKASIQILGEILSCMSPEQQEPFYDILSVHLRCSMTHININIQKDSLTFLEVILNHAPGVVRQNPRILVRNYMRLLANFRYGSHLEGLLTMGSKNELKMTRIQILNSLYKIFGTIFVPSMNSDGQKNPEVYYQDVKRYPIRSAANTYKTVPNLCHVVRRTRPYENDNLEEEVTDLRAFIDLVMPMLLDTWAEFGPATKEDKEFFAREYCISGFSAKVLETILKIMELLFEQATEYDGMNKGTKERERFILIYREPYSQRFLTYFPYAPMEGNAQFMEGITPHSYTIINLVLCYLYYQLQTKEYESDPRIDKYVTGALSRNDRKDSAAAIVVKLTSLLLTNPLHNRHTKRTNRMLTAALAAYDASYCAQVREGLFHVLSKIACSDDLAHLRQHAQFRVWVSRLPTLLLKPEVSVHVLTVINALMNKKDADILETVNSQVVDILEWLPELETTGIPRRTGQKMVANIVYCCDQKNLVEIFDKIVLNRSYPKTLKQYVMDIFAYKLSTPTE